jgi:hypothetical protein
MFSFLSPRLWMLIGLGVALLAAFLAGVKVESNRRDAALLAQQQKYQKEVDALREKERLVQEQTVKALEEERNKNQALSTQIQQAMKQAEVRGGAIQVRMKCPAQRPARPAVLSVRAETGPSDAGAASSMPPPGASGPVASAAAADSGTAPSSLLNSADPQPEASDVTTRVSIDDRIFYAGFIGLYNTAITRQPERLPQAAGRADGGDSAATPVSGRDIIENLDENGKRFADCREKLKAWQNWARKLDLAR